MFQPEWRNRLIVTFAALLAIVAGAQTATGGMIWVEAAVVAAGLIVLAYVQPIPIAALILGFVTAGYVVGNRGFAQLSLVSGFPLLPAECALGAGVVAVAVGCGFGRKLPFAKDALNYAIIGWIVVGTVRFLFDFNAYGFEAVRDFATVYYALFFFIAQYFAGQPVASRFLVGCLYVGGAILLALQPFYHWWPEFFFHTFTVRGTPLIYYKGDLLETFLAVTSLLYFLRYELTGKKWAMLLSLLALVPVASSDNRAALVGLWAATAVLCYGKRWKFAVYQIVGGIAAVVVILMVAFSQGKSWESTGVFKFYERVVSIVDYSGQGHYEGRETANKGENNAFRSVWWTAAVDETIEGNPWVGLGFGHDLAARFLQEYYPTKEDDFTVRSPHNIFVTIFARMGLLGLLSFLAIVYVALKETLVSVKRPRSRNDSVPFWCCTWAILVSASFGVVLEGPMGAVVFWVLLGLAHHAYASPVSIGGEAAADSAKAARSRDEQIAERNI